MKIAILGKQNPMMFREKMRDNLVSAGHSVDILDMQTRNFLDFADQIRNYDGVITCGEKLPTKAIQMLGEGNLKIISRWGVGTDEIDKQEAARQGIAVCNAPGSLSTAVAECAISMMIDLLREFPARDASVRENDWSWFFEGLLSHQLEGKTVGLVGFGNIAKALAKMLYGFDCRIIAWDDYGWDEEAAEKYGVQRVSMEELVRTSDVVSLHLAATADTFDMVNREFLTKMKNTAILINTARGALVDEDALVWALENGVIAAAGLDVFKSEPPAPDCRLLKLDNVILLPHSGAGSYECLEKSSAMASGNVIDFFAGKSVRSILNPDDANHPRG